MNEQTKKPSMELSRFARSADLHRKDLYILKWEKKVDCKTFVGEDVRIVFEKMPYAIVGVRNTIKFFVKRVGFAGYDYAKLVKKDYRRIPREVREAYLFFPGTIWQSGSGFYFVPVLRSHDTSEWELDFYNVTNGIPAGSYVAIAVPIGTGMEIEATE